MKNFIYVNRIIGLLMLILLSGCGGNDSDRGACIWGSGIGSGCWDDYTPGQCNMMNGTLYKGKSCSDYGYTSS